MDSLDFSSLSKSTKVPWRQVVLYDDNYLFLLEDANKLYFRYKGNKIRIVDFIKNEYTEKTYGFEDSTNVTLKKLDHGCNTIKCIALDQEKNLLVYFENGCFLYNGKVYPIHKSEAEVNSIIFIDKEMVFLGRNCLWGFNILNPLKVIKVNLEMTLKESKSELFLTDKKIHLNALTFENKTAYQNVLLIGEGDFSYTRELVRLFPDFGPTLFSSDLELLQLNKKIKGQLEKSKVEIMSVDATDLSSFEKKNIERIQWNMPFKKTGGIDFKETKEFRKTMVLFFQQCSEIQKIGDRVHIILAQEQDYFINRQYESNLFKASLISKYQFYYANYFFERGNPDSFIRYKNYNHCSTNKGTYIGTPDKIEFVFQKVKRVDRLYKVKSGSTKPRKNTGDKEIEIHYFDFEGALRIPDFFQL